MEWLVPIAVFKNCYALFKNSLTGGGILFSNERLFEKSESWDFLFSNKPQHLGGSLR